jgi:hypothetical protein
MTLGSVVSAADRLGWEVQQRRLVGIGAEPVDAVLTVEFWKYGALFYRLTSLGQGAFPAFEFSTIDDEGSRATVLEAATSLFMRANKAALNGVTDDIEDYPVTRRSTTKHAFRLALWPLPDGMVRIVVRSRDHEPGGFAQAVDLQQLNSHGYAVGDERSVPLAAQAMLVPEELNDHSQRFTSDKEGSANVVTWVTEPLLLDRGSWDASVAVGSDIFWSYGSLEFTIPPETDMTKRRVFISYLHDDSKRVDQLVTTIKRAGYPVWMDREDLVGGMRWKDEIRNAISTGLAMIACFSRSYDSRESSHMNEELTLAIDEIRARPTSRAWFIPVRLDACDIPLRHIGGGETLRDLQSIDLFPDELAGRQRVVRAIERIHIDAAGR